VGFLWLGPKLYTPPRVAVGGEAYLSADFRGGSIKDGFTDDEKWWNNVYRVCYTSAFSFAFGPLAFAAVFFGNFLLFHSVDRMTNTSMHMYPVFVMYLIRWHPAETEVYPDMFAYQKQQLAAWEASGGTAWQENFFDLSMRAPLAYGAHMGLSLFAFFGLKLLPEGYWCLYTVTVESRRQMMYKIMGKYLIDEHTMKSYMGTTNFVMTIMCLPCCFYFNSFVGAAGYVLFVFSVIMWNTADWYVKMLMTSTKLK